MVMTDLHRVQEQFLNTLTESSSKLTTAWTDAFKSTGVEDVLENYRTIMSRSFTPPIFRSLQDASLVATKLQEIISMAAEDLPRFMEAQGNPEQVKAITDRWTGSYQGLLRQIFGLPRRSELGRFTEKWRSFLTSLAGEPPPRTESLLPDFFTMLMAPYLPGKPEPAPSPFQIWTEASQRAMESFFLPPKAKPARQYREKAKSALDAQHQFLQMLPPFQEHVLEGSQKAVEKIVSRIAESIAKADIRQLDADSYSKFWKIWIAHNEEIFLSLFKSERFSRTLAETLNAGLEARKKMDALTADWFSLFNIPSGKDMEEVHQALQNLTVRTSSLEDELAQLKAELQSLARRQEEIPEEQNSQ